MKSLIFYFLTFTTIADFGWAQTVLVRSASANESDFNYYLSDSSSVVAHVDYLRKLMTHTSSAQEEALFQLADNLYQTPLEILTDVEIISSRAPLTPTALMFLGDLLRRIEPKARTAREKELLKKHLCKVELLTQGFSANSCHQIKIETGSIKQSFPFAEILFLESKEIKVYESLQIEPETKFNWTLASNAYQSIHFFGTYAEFLNQSFTPQPLVSGSCQSPVIQVDLNLLNRTQAFFSKDCVGHAVENQNTLPSEGWFLRNRKWLIPVGLLVAGGVALSLKDKTLVFHLPF